MTRVIDGLRELHTIDQQLAEVRRETERLPAALTDIEQELAAFEEKKSGLLAEARDRQVVADSTNVEIKRLEEKTEKYQVQLNIAKTQKEFDTLKSEITAAQNQISNIETGALTAYEEADQLTTSARELAPLMEAAEEKLKTARGELDDRLADLDHRKEKLFRARGEHVKGIDSDDLKLYDQVLSKHANGAMTAVKDGLCTICNMRLTPQSYNLVLIGERTQQCRSCGRICYSEDEPGAG